MANRKAEELRALSDADLQKELDEAHRELFNLRFRHATRQLENDRLIPEVRKKIARIRTIQTERRLAAAQERGS
ncbi:MAG TPA: 50S ribosomal protein L29 [Dehalococcoidia bacterium]